MNDHLTEIIVFSVLFLLVSGMGFVAARWRRPDDLATSTSGGSAAAASAAGSPGSSSAATSTPPTPSWPCPR